MGYYVNVPGQPKEIWLELNKTSISFTPPIFENVSSEDRIVILVDNGMFTAAGVAYDKREYEDFTDPNDRRQKLYYTVPYSKLVQVIPDLPA